MDIIGALLSGNALSIREVIKEKLNELAREKFESMKLMVIQDIFGDVDTELVLERFTNIQKTGRTKMIRVRVRKGKVQHKKHFSTKKGYTIRGGHMVQMTSMERRHRMMGAKKARVKRRSNFRQALRKRRVSLRKRHSLGL